MLLGINSQLLAAEINAARERIYFCGAGISLDIAEAIVKASTRLHPENIIILTDASAHSRRLGYGDQSSLERLSDLGISLYELPDTRLAFCIVDDRAWIFSQLPALVEKPDINAGFNCLELTGNEVGRLVDTVQLVLRDSKKEPGSSSVDIHPESLLVAEKNVTWHPDLPIPGIAVKAKPLEKSTIQKTSEELKKNPPQPFDVSRQVVVFNSRLEFVELKLIGTKIESQVFKFPDEIKSTLTEDEDAQKRLSASFKMIGDNSNLSSKKITEKIDKVRKAYLKPVGKLGRVIKRSNKGKFEEELKKIKQEIEKYKEELGENLQNEMDSSRDALVKMFEDRIMRNPPMNLEAEVEGPKVTLQDARDYLHQILKKNMPNVSKIQENITLTCVYKSVTYEMLKDNEFQEMIRKLYPQEKWDQPLDESTVAHGTTHPNVRR